MVYLGKPSRNTEPGCRLKSVLLAATGELWAPKCLGGAHPPRARTAASAPIRTRKGRGASLSPRGRFLDSFGYSSSARTLAYARGWGVGEHGGTLQNSLCHGLDCDLSLNTCELTSFGSRVRQMVKFK